MQEVIFSLIVFIIIYLIYWITVILRKKKLEKFKNNTYVRYLQLIYHIDIERINIKSLAKVIALTNSFIISFTLYFISITDSLFLMLLLAVAIFIPLQLLSYHIIGKYYQKKQRSDHHV